MKNIFGVDMTLSEENAIIDGQVFLSAQIPEEQQKAIDGFEEDAEELNEKAQLPKPLRALKTVAGMVALLCLLIFARLLDDEGTEPLYWLLIPAAVGGAVFLLLFVLERRRGRDMMESRDFARFEETADRVDRESRAILGIPADAASIDIFGYAYKLKKGKEKPVTTLFDYINLDLFVFRDGDALCLADHTNKYTFPLAALTGIRRIDKRVRFPEWNKAEAHHKEPYKSFKIGYYDEVYSVKPYYALDMLHDGEEYTLLFPSYELATVENLTGLKAPEKD